MIIDLSGVGHGLGDALTADAHVVALHFGGDGLDDLRGKVLGVVLPAVHLVLSGLQPLGRVVVIPVL